MDIPEQLQYVIGQIKKLRIQKGISQMELSLRSGLSQSFLATLEKGKKLPSVLTVIKIADALDVNPTDFFPEKTNAGSKQQIKDKIIDLLKYL
ncbi:MAG: helix-turn-helix domain-containing protein [Treponema sp.]|jgi:transcriptional regulator with XRE-family HTH domain|nr:helix-turn-helix domain-containing protein [Treponema sp.]